jgi:hypothetical protein
MEAHEDVDNQNKTAENIVANQVEVEEDVDDYDDDDDNDDDKSLDKYDVL